MPFSIVAAVDEKGGMAKNGGLPWHLPADFKFFKELTSRSADPSRQNVVLMGRKTWESLPAKFRPLPGRINVVISRHADFDMPEGVYLQKGLEEAVRFIDRDLAPRVSEVFVIGGAAVYEQAIRHPLCKRIYLTRIFADFDCDLFFPTIPQRFYLSRQGETLIENELVYAFLEYSSGTD